MLDKQAGKMPRQEMTGGGVPEFFVDEDEFRCGYAPRAMEYSLRSDTLFVGCKDGTITIVENLAGRKTGRKIQCSRVSSSDSLSREQAGDHAELGLDGVLPLVPAEGQARPGLTVRAMCEWCEGWLLVARDDGRIDLLNWKEAKERERIICLWEGGDAGGPDSQANRITYMDWLDRSRLLLSFRSSGTRIIHYVQGENVPAAAQKAFEVALRDPQPPWTTKIAGICCAVSIANGREKGMDWIWASQSGTVWVAQDRPEGIQPGDPIQQVWPEGETPGFITDFALIKLPDVEPKREEDDGFDVRDQKNRGAYPASCINFPLDSLQRPV